MEGDVGTLLINHDKLPVKQYDDWIKLTSEQKRLQPWHRCPFLVNCNTCGFGQSTKFGDENLPIEQDWRDLNAPVMCICLEDRQDRLEAVTTEFHRVGLCKLVTFYRPVRPSDELMNMYKVTGRGTLGCWMSHQQCQLFVLNYIDPSRLLTGDQNITRCLQFEDDLCFTKELTRGSLKTIKQHLDFLDDTQTKKEPWAYYLGMQPFSVKRKSSWPPQMFKLMAGCTHAVIYNKPLINHIINTKPYKSRLRFDMHIDTHFALKIKQFGIVPMLAVQSDSKSDIDDERGKIHRWYLTQRRQCVGTVTFLAHRVVPIGLPVLLVVFLLFLCSLLRSYLF